MQSSLLDSMADRLEKARSRNLRQLLLRAARIVNRDVVRALQDRGYAELKSTHTTLLSNMALAGSTVRIAVTSTKNGLRIA